MLKVKFPTLGEYDYDSSDKMYHFNVDDKLEREKHDEEFWARYDPFEPYDHFEPCNTYESYDKWQEECLKEAMGDPILYTSLTGHDPPSPNERKVEPDKSTGKPESSSFGPKEFMEGRLRVMLHPVQEMNHSCLVYSLRLLACLILAVALYCFCNGYQEVKFLEIVNKCLEGHHNPMCEGFMEPESTMNDYKAITVQEDMYSDRLEWIPKVMTPAQEYVTLVSILDRHPCQSLRCLDKLTAQIYGGIEGSSVAGQSLQNSGSKSKRKPVPKHELRDRMDDVLKKMGHYGGNELKEEVMKKNKEYLTRNDSVGFDVTHKGKFVDNKSTVNKSRFPNYEHGNKLKVRRMAARDGNRHTRTYGYQNLKLEDTVIQNQPVDLPERSDFLIDSLVDRSPSDPSEFSGATNGETRGDFVQAAQDCASVVVSRRFDCHPEGDATPEKCAARGCCWNFFLAKQSNHSDSSKNEKYNSARIRPPFCFYPPSYVAYSVIHHQDTPTGQEALLQLLRPSGHEGDVAELRLQIVYETETRLKIQIQPSGGEAQPVPVLPLTGKSSPALPGVNPHQLQRRYLVSLTRHNAALTVTRADSNATMFSTAGAAPLVFARQFLQVSSYLPSSAVYGLGQHRDGLMLDVDWSRYIMWNADQPPQPGLNLYGSHPFYLAMESGGSSHGVFFLNSNAMSAVLQPAPAVTLQSTGGIMTLYVLTGPSPGDVVRQYIQLVGQPSLPPYWALGYHQCRFGYRSLAETKKVWKRTRDAEIPFDVQWNDLDYMASRKDFTLDTLQFGGLPQFVDELHQLGMHYVPIIDPGISSSEAPGSYLPYDEGSKMGIFVRNSSGQFFQGKVWSSGSTVWPDFSHPRAMYYWARQLVRFHGLVPFDGAWIDMNEPSNFYSGTVQGCNLSSPLNAPPWVPSGLVGGALYHKTVCPDALQYIGRHYDLHNLFGNMEAVATNVLNKLQSVTRFLFSCRGLKVTRGERPLVISRASFPGLGVWAGHWTGDVTSDWDNLRASLPDVLNFNMFGIPLVGADICGFNGNTTAALCLRWMQLGAFYPFARNHNTEDGIDQDPVAMGPDVVTASRSALHERYRLLPYLYTLFYRAHVFGDTVARPLFLQFPRDAATYSIDSQFLWGDGLMIVPAMEENVTVVDAYLPCGSIWYDWYTGERVGADPNFSLDEKNSLLRNNTTAPSAFTSDQGATEAIVNSHGLNSTILKHTDSDANSASEASTLNEVSSKIIVRRSAFDLNDSHHSESSFRSPNGIASESSRDVPMPSGRLLQLSRAYETQADYSAADTSNETELHVFEGHTSDDGSEKTVPEFEEPGCFYVQLAAPLDKVPLLVRGGAVIPTQQPGLTTTASRTQPFSVIVALDQTGEACGQLYLDDGVSIDPVGSESFTLLDLRASDRKLVISSDYSGYKAGATLDAVRVYGVAGVVESVTLNGEPRPFHHDAATKVLEVENLKWNLPLYFVLKW
ncbi:Glycoside hydrolase family 31 N-terminal domain [Trinorchestia longiramus]|nr:Glycoside hydrolase family 31 N-terminal domain [Trinorchestia longiramus]